jgi:hypothetical protein
MEYTLSFTFETNNENDILAAELKITDSNTISLASNPNEHQQIQIQPAQYAMPPLSIVVTPKSISVQAQQNTPGNHQSVAVTVCVNAVGTQLKGNLILLGNAPATVHYQFVGYGESNNIGPGAFVIPFPS